MRLGAAGWLGAGVILLAGIYAYSVSLHGGWLWDDDQYITGNLLLRSGAGLKEIWAGRGGVNYFPLTSTVEWVQWHAWGDRPLGYHGCNLALHLAAALLVWRLAARLGVGALGAWIAGLFFAVHPVTVESVAWVSELKNTLSTPLVLLALMFYLDFEGGAHGPHVSRTQSRDALSRRWWILSVLCFLAAMLSKSTVAMFPLVLLLHAWWRRGRVTLRDGLLAGPYFLISLALGLVTIALERTRAIGAAGPPLESLGSRLALAAHSLLFYLGKCVWPAGFTPIYPRWSAAGPGTGSLLPWAILLAGAAALWTQRLGWGRHALFALGAFVLSLAPVLGLVPMAYLRLSWVADHFAYLALVSFVILAGAALDALSARWSQLRPRWVLAAAAVLAAGWAAQVRAYSRAFASPEALWTWTLRRNPDAWSAHNDLGSIRFDQGRLPEAITEFLAAVHLNPDYAEAFNNLGVALAQSGSLLPALSAYRQALTLKPGYAEAHCNLGNALLQTGRPDEAVPEYREAIRLRTPFPEAHYNLGLALRALGREAEAQSEFRQAVGLL